MTMFAPAVRTQKKLRIAIDGPSGAGKTYSALLVAQGLAKGDLSKVAVIDTEHGSASLYAALGGYAVAAMDPPYSVERYVQALGAAAHEGYEVVIVDSLTHAWSGEGGILDYVDRVAKTKTSGNSFAAWKEGTPLQKHLTDAILGSPCHVIVTMRTKTEYVIEEDDRGKKVPKKIGLAPEQRKDLEYDMDLVLDMTREHIATASKDRTGVWAERMETPSPAHGAELLAWLNEGDAAPVAPVASAAPILGADQWLGMVAGAGKLGVAQERLALAFATAGYQDPTQAPLEVAKAIYTEMQAGVAARQTLHDAQREQAAAAQTAPEPISITKAQAEQVRGMCYAKGIEQQAVANAAGVASLDLIPAARWNEVVAGLQGLPDPTPPQPGPTQTPAATPPPQSAPPEAQQQAAAREAQRPDGCNLDTSFMECKALRDGRLPNCQQCEHFDADFAALDKATRRDTAPAPAWGEPRKIGTVDTERLKRLAIKCNELEQLGVSTLMWRQAMWTEESVQSRRELSKAAADRMLKYLTRWATGVAAGTTAPNEGAAA